MHHVAAAPPTSVFNIDFDQGRTPARASFVNNNSTEPSHRPGFRIKKSNNALPVQKATKSHFLPIVTQLPLTLPVNFATVATVRRRMEIENQSGIVSRRLRLRRCLRLRRGIDPVLLAGRRVERIGGESTNLK